VFGFRSTGISQRSRALHLQKNRSSFAGASGSANTRYEKCGHSRVPHLILHALTATEYRMPAAYRSAQRPDWPRFADATTGERPNGAIQPPQTGGGGQPPCRRHEDGGQAVSAFAPNQPAGC
jgi:hypothetical protein